MEEEAEKRKDGKSICRAKKKKSATCFFFLFFFPERRTVLFLVQSIPIEGSPWDQSGEKEEERKNNLV